MRFEAGQDFISIRENGVYLLNSMIINLELLTLIICF